MKFFSWFTMFAHLTSLWSAASPRSMTRPSVVVSMLPPHMGTTTVLPFHSGVSMGPPGRMGVRPMAPPPSTTSFSFSMSLGGGGDERSD